MGAAKPREGGFTPGPEFLDRSKLLPKPYLSGTADQLAAKPNRSPDVGRVAVVEIQVQFRIDFPSYEAPVGRRDRHRDRPRGDVGSICDHVTVGEQRQSRFEADAVDIERRAE